MPQLCPAHWGSCNMCPAMPDPCILPGIRSLLTVCNVPSSTLVSTGGHYTHRLPWGEDSLGFPPTPCSLPPPPSPCVTCSDHHRVVLLLQLLCSPGMGQPHCRQPQGQMPAPQPVGQAACAQSSPEHSCHCPTVPGHGCPLPSSLDFAFTAELFPVLLGMGRRQGARPGNALAQGHTLCPRACGEAEQNNGTGTMLPTQRCLQQGTEPWQSLAGGLWGGWRPAPVLRR